MRNDGHWRADFWYVVQPEPRGEGLLMTQLSRTLFEVYRPVTLIERRINGRGDTAFAPRPLVPGYIFVRKLTPEAPVLTRMPGLRRVFPNGVRQKFIDVLKAAEVDEIVRLKPLKVQNPAAAAREEPQIRAEARARLKAGRVSSFEELRDLLLSDPDGDVRLSAFQALMQTEGEMVASAMGEGRKALP